MRLAKRIFSVIIVVAIAIGIMPIGMVRVFALPPNETIECGENVICDIDYSTKTATFSGVGEISFDDVSVDYGYYIHKIVVGEGITGGFFGTFYMTNELNLPSTFEKIHPEDFNYGMYGLNLCYVNVSENNPNYSSQDGVVYNKDKSELVFFPAEQEAKEFTIPAGVTKIGDYAFEQCRNLESVTMSETVEEIGNYAFFWCDNLREINLSSKCTKFGASAFYYCESLVSIDIPEGTTTLADSLFNSCLSLGEIDIPESVTEIGHYAFYDCDELKTVVIPKNVSSLGDGSAWNYCDNLTNFSVADGNKYFTTINGVLYSKDKTKLIAYPTGRQGVAVVEAGTKEIGDHSFGGASKLKTIILPDELTHIGVLAFYACSIDAITIPDGVTEIGHKAFEGTNIKRLTLPRSVKYMYSSFWYCKEFEELTVLNSDCYFNISLPGDFMIRGYKGSTAEEFATHNSLPFVNLDTRSDYYKEIGQTVVVTRNTNGTALAGCTITVGDKEYIADSHTTFVDVPEGYTGDITVSKEGYITNSLSAEFLKKYNFFVMYPDTETKPIVQHFLLRSAKSSDNNFVDLLRSTETIYDLGNKKHDIYINVNSNTTQVKSIYLLQGSKKVELQNGMNYDINSNGTFSSSEGTIYLCIEDTNGTIYKTNSGIIAAKTKVTLDADIGGEVSGTVDEELSAVGGWEYNGKVKFGKVPMSFSISENKIKGTIGLTGNEEFTATAYEAIGGVIGKHTDVDGVDHYSSEEIEELVKGLKDSGYDVAEGYTSFGIDVSGSIIGTVEGTWNPEKCMAEDMTINLILKIQGEMSYKQQSSFVVVAVPVPYYWNVQFSMAVATAIGGSWTYDENNTVNFAMEMPSLSLETELEAKLCLGLDGICGGGGRAKGGVEIKFNAPDYDFTASVWTLSYEVGLTGQIAGFSGDLNLKDGTYQLYPDDETTTEATVSENLMSDYALSTELIAAEYSLSPSTYSNKADGTLYNFKTNGYTYSSPTVATLSDGTAVMVWNDYDDERSDINKTALFYSVFDPDENSWSSPSQVENDGTADDFPVLKTFNDKVYLVWNDADKALADGDTFVDMVSGMGISYAEFDGTKFGSVSSVSGQNNYMDVCADIVVIDNQPVVTWLENQENDVFGQNGSNVINVAKLKDGAWDKKTVLDTTCAINSIAIANEKGSEAVYYSMDADGNVETYDDYEVFKLHNNETTQLTNDANSPSSLYTYGSTVYWLEQNTIKSSAGDSLVCEGIGNEYMVIEDETGVRSVVYTVYNADGVTEYMLCKETEFGFSEPISLTSGKYLCGGFDVYWKDEALVLASNEINEENYSSSVNIYEINNSPDLLIENTSYDQYTLMEGGTLRSVVSVKNNGIQSVDGYKIYAYEGENLLSTYEAKGILLPGDVRDSKLYIDLPENIDFSQIDFVVEYIFGKESIQSEKYAMSLSLKDISVENAVIITDETSSVLNVAIANRGIEDLSDIKVNIHKGSKDGEIIDSRVISELSSRQENIIQLDVSDYLDETKQIYVTVEPLENEESVGNNHDFAVVSEYIRKEVVFDTYEALIVNEEKVVALSEDELSEILVLTPEEAGLYSIKLSSEFSSKTVIKDRDGNVLSTQEGKEYTINQQLEENKFYYIETTLDISDDFNGGDITYTILAKNTTSNADKLGFSLNADGESYSVCSCDKNTSGAIGIPREFNNLPVTKIDDSAFEKCTGITSVSIPESITNIGDYAFYGCENLSEIELPDSLNNIGVNAFNNTAYYNNEDNWDGDVLYYRNYLIAVLDDYQAGPLYIKDGTTLCVRGALQNDVGFTEVYFPASLINMNSDIIFILDEITVDEENPSYTVLDGVLFDKDISQIIAYPRNKKDTTYEIPDTVSVINSGAFREAHNLRQVTIPDSVYYIGDMAFYDSGLTSVQLSDYVTYVGMYAFASYATKCVSFGRNVEYIGICAVASPFVTVFLPAGVTGFQNYAICCEGSGVLYYEGAEAQLNELVENAYIVGDFATYTSSQTKAKKSGDYLYVEDSQSKITLIDYIGCSENVNVPSEIDGKPVTDIGTAFLNYNMDDEFEFISNNIKEITISANITDIKPMAFAGCVELEKVSLSDSLTTIGDYAFAECTNLCSITLPNTLSEIGSGVFESCASLSDIYYTGSEDEWSEIAIGEENEWLDNVNIHYNHACNGEWITTKNATCVDSGEKTRVCSVCGKKEVVELDALGHNFDDGVCSRCGLNELLGGVESLHPYDSDTDESWTIHKDGAKRITITFSEDTETEEGYDFIYIYNANDVLVGCYSGTELAGEKVTVHSDTVRIRLTSDGSYEFYGFSIDDVKVFYEDCAHSDTEVRGESDAYCCLDGYTGDEYCTECGELVAEGTVIPADGVTHEMSINVCEPTCTEGGYTMHFCWWCDYSYKTDETEPTGVHNYVNGICENCNEKDPSYVMPTLNVGETKTVTVSYESGGYYFSFIPEQSGVYSFTSIGDIDTFGSICDENMSELIDDDDSGTDYNFRLTHYLEKGEKYIINCGLLEDGPVSYDVKCSYDFYTVEGTEIKGDYFYIPCGKSLVKDILSVSEDITLDYTTNNNYFGTGTKVSYTDEYDNVYSYNIVVPGDVNGDGFCDVLDSSQMALASSGKKTLDGAYALAGDSNADDIIDISDYQDVVNKAVS